jgi:hypothetical protein
MGGKLMAKSQRFPPSTIGQKHQVASKRFVPTKQKENA